MMAMRLEPKLHIGGIGPDEQRCLRCGSGALDTGWECTDCGYDNMPHYVEPTLPPEPPDDRP